MRRRDTIIVAVIVNAALLMILFATAMRSDKDPTPKVQELAAVAPKKKEPVVQSSSKKDLLNEYVAATPAPITIEKNKEIIVPYDEEITLEVAARYEEPAKIESKSEESQLASINEGEFVNVTVKKGDFLEKIARANNTTVSLIMQANKLSSTQLKIGQVLKIPLGTIVESTNKPAAPSRAEEIYVVKEGDNPWLIATRNKISLDELLRLNGLDEQKARKLRPGDKLKIR